MGKNNLHARRALYDRKTRDFTTMTTMVSSLSVFLWGSFLERRFRAAPEGKRIRARALFCIYADRT